MDGAGDDRALLVGEWESGEAFGNTALDWSQAVKDGAVTAALCFSSDGSYSFRLVRTAGDAPSGQQEDVTASFRHVVASEGVFEVLEGNALVISGDTSGIRWSFQLEEDDALRIRLEGAKRFGRCKGVDVIYFRRVRR